MKVIDFPAGHSMDTEWFAVDKDGNIAVFDSSDEGVVPVKQSGETYFSTFIYYNSKPITKFLREFILCDEQVDFIINLCNKSFLEELKISLQNEKNLYFTGFILLGSDYNYFDLGFEDVFKDSDESLIYCISKKKQLFYIEDAYELKDTFFKAVEDGKIISCVNTHLWGDNDDKQLYDSFQFGVFRYENNYAIHPYVRVNTPKYPLNIKYLAKNARTEIISYPQISFFHSKYIQPLEFDTCESYSIDSITHNTESDAIDNGYARLLLSDNSTEALCRIFVKEWISSVKIRYCSICNRNHTSYATRSFLPFAFQDFPRILVIEANLIDVRELEYTTKIEKQILNHLEIPLYDVFITSCIKCYIPEFGLNDEEIIRRFSYCWRNLLVEIEALEPYLIVCVGLKTFDLINAKFALSSSFFKADSISEIKIGDSSIPFLISNSIDEINENLANLSGTVHSILSNKKVRKIEKKPRVILD